MVINFLKVFIIIVIVEKTYTKNGTKAYQRGNDIEDRGKDYKNWHRTLDKSLLMLDIDSIEYRFKNGIFTPVGVFEITRVDLESDVPESYLQAIKYRFFKRDSIQARSALTVACSLKTKAYIVLYRKNLKDFWVYCLSNGVNDNWKHYTKEEYELFLKSL